MNNENKTAVIENEPQVEEVPLHERKLNCTGYCSTNIEGTDSRIAGDTFDVDGRTFILTNERRPRVYDETERRMVSADEDLYQRVLDMEQQDYDVMKARDEYAVHLAHGDEILASVYRCALEYGNGQIEEPETHDGVTLFKVGRNASHMFFLGAKDGKMYKAALCYDYDEVNDKTIEDWSGPREVESLQGEYLGHY
jgi:hypothetical protein